MRVSVGRYPKSTHSMSTTRPVIVGMLRTGATNKNSRDKNWAENMSTKYSVASRRIVSKILGIVGYLLILGLIAVNTIIENAATSTVP